MDYFSILNLNKEPFSNSPDPDYFFHSQQHISCLQKLELSLRLRRGLNVVVGEVGTGKTTLCRQLIRKFSSDDEVETHLRWDFISRPDRNYVHGTGIQLGGSGNYGAILRVPLAKCLFFAACARSGGKFYWSKEASLVIRGFSISYPSEVAVGEPPR